MIQGYATHEGTKRYKERFEKNFAEKHFSKKLNLFFSSIGMGSYLGKPDDADDRAYEEAFAQAAASGINVFDAAINYRAQRSERSFGRALQKAVEDGTVQRDEVMICTKGGFLPFDGSYASDSLLYYKKHFIDTGLIRPEELVAGCHSLAPKFLENQLEQSLSNLNLECIDIYYLHNPEIQLGEVDQTTFIDRLREAFLMLEKKAADGKIRYYGLATWDGFRAAPDEDTKYLSFEELMILAREVGGPNHHLRAVQLPFNIAMPEAWIMGNQHYGGHLIPVFGLTGHHEIAVMTSATLLQAKLAGDVPASFRDCFPGLKSSAQCSIQLARSIPAITAALVGMKQKAHVEENLATAQVPVLSESELILKFQQQ